MLSKKSGRLSLRMDADIHVRIARTADRLGMDINGLLNWIIRTNLPTVEAIGNAAADARISVLRGRWRELNPKRSEHWFWDEFFRMKELRDPVRFEDGKDYLLNDAGDGFVVAPASAPRTQRR
jgi:hypothetical protein